MLLSKAAQNRAESRHLNAVEPSGAQTCPPRLTDLLQKQYHKDAQLEINPQQLCILTSRPKSAFIAFMNHESDTWCLVLATY